MALMTRSEKRNLRPLEDGYHTRDQLQFSPLFCSLVIAPGAGLTVGFLSQAYGDSGLQSVAMGAFFTVLVLALVQGVQHGYMLIAPHLSNPGKQQGAWIASGLFFAAFTGIFFFVG